MKQRWPLIVATGLLMMAWWLFRDPGVWPRRGEAHRTGEVHRTNDVPPQTTREPEASDVGDAAGEDYIELLVIDDNGDPAGGAAVRVVRDRSFSHEWYSPTQLSAVSDQTGRARIELSGHESGGQFEAAATSSDGRLATLRETIARRGGLTRLVLFPSATVRVRVLGLEGSDRGRVVAYCPHWPEAPGTRTIAPAQKGLFFVRGVTRMLHVFATADGRAPSRATTLRVAPGVTYDLDLELGQRTEQSRARLTDPSGSGLPVGTLVQTREEGRAWLTTLVEADGGFEILGVTARTPFEIYVWPTKVNGRWHTARRRFRVDPAHQSSEGPFEVPFAARADFLVRDEGGPVRNLAVRLAPVPKVGVTSPARGIKAGVTDSEGRFVAFDTAIDTKGSWVLSSLGGLVLWKGDPTASRGDDTHIVTLDSSVLVVSVRLVDEKGASVTSSFVRTTLLPPKGLPRSRQMVDFEDSAVVRFVMPRTWLGRAMVVVDQTWGTRRTLAISGSSEIRVTAGSESCALTIVPDADFIDGASIWLTHEERPRVRYRLHVRGKRVYRGLVPGRYDWKVMSKWVPGPPLSGALELVTGTTTRVRIR